MTNPVAPEPPVAGKFIYVPNDLIRPKPDWVSQSLWHDDGADIPAAIRGEKTYDGLPVALTIGRNRAASLGAGETRSLIFETFFVKTTGGGKTVATRTSKSPIAVPKPIPIMAGIFCFAPVSGGLFVVRWGHGVVEVDVEEVTGPEPDPEKPRPPPVIEIKYSAAAESRAFYMFAQFGTGKYELYYVHRKDGGGWKLARVVIPATMREFNVTELRNGHNGRVRVRAYDGDLVNELWVTGAEVTFADFSLWKKNYKLTHGVEIASGVAVFGRQGMSRVTGSMFKRPRAFLDSSAGQEVTELLSRMLLNLYDTPPAVFSVGAGLALAVVASPWPIKNARPVQTYGASKLDPLYGWVSNNVGFLECPDGISFIASFASRDLIVTDGVTAWMIIGPEQVGDTPYLDAIDVYPITGGNAIIRLFASSRYVETCKTSMYLFKGGALIPISIEKIYPVAPAYAVSFGVVLVMVAASGEILMFAQTNIMDQTTRDSTREFFTSMAIKDTFVEIEGTRAPMADGAYMLRAWVPYQTLGGDVCFIRTATGNVNARWFRGGALLKTLTVVGSQLAVYATGRGFLIAVRGEEDGLYYLAETDDDDDIVMEYVGPVVYDAACVAQVRVARDIWALPMKEGIFLFSPIPYVDPNTPKPHRHFSLRKITDWGATIEKMQCLGEYLLHVAPDSIYDLRPGGAVNNPPY